VKRIAVAALAFTLLGTAGTIVRADDSADEHLARAKDAHARGDFATTRDELLAAYHIDPRPALLFALGQVELNLGNYEQAIAYYEQFKATNPSTEDLALAEQAIGAARIELQRPHKTESAPPPPPPPKLPPHREWDAMDTTLLIAGGAAMIGGGISIAVGVNLPNDTNSTLHTYEARVNDAYLARDIGIATLAAGALVAGGAVLRWRLHLVETVNIETTHGGVAVQVGGRL
jgi:tetratricopeptide (TPR) repeat protein